MSSHLSPYINFRGDARQAMEFYKNVLGGELNMQTYGEFGHPDAALKDLVMHAMLDTGHGFSVMASDLPADAGHKPGNNVSICLYGDDADNLHTVWEKISADSQVTMPMEKQAWGDEFGSCVDKFGVPWMINIG